MSDILGRYAPLSAKNKCINEHDFANHATEIALDSKFIYKALSDNTRKSKSIKRNLLHRGMKTKLY